MKTRNKAEMVAWFAMGTALGTLAGLLFAPKTGKDVRGQVAKAAEKVGEQIAKSSQTLFEKSKVLAGDTADVVKKATGAA